MAYDIYPGVDSTFNFPSVVRAAMAASAEIQSAMATVGDARYAVTGRAKALEDGPAVSSWYVGPQWYSNATATDVPNLAKQAYTGAVASIASTPVNDGVTFSGVEFTVPAGRWIVFGSASINGGAISSGRSVVNLKVSGTDIARGAIPAGETDGSTEVTSFSPVPFKVRISFVQTTGGSAQCSHRVIFTRLGNGAT